MSYLEKLNELANEKDVNTMYQLLNLVHELEIKEFKEAFLALGVNEIDFEDKAEQPAITFNGYDEPVQARVLGIRKESDSTILITLDSWSGYDSVHLCDVEIGHLDFLIDYFPEK